MKKIRKTTVKRLGSILTALVAASFLVPASVPAEDSLKDLTGNLIELRGEVQELNNNLEETITDHRNRMQSLERQRVELEAEIKRKERHVEKLEQTLADNRQEAGKAGPASGELRTAALQGIRVNRERIENGLPFKVKERLKEIGELETKLEEDLIPPPKAVNRLWAFFEDELRLAGEIGIYRQPVNIDGRKRLAEVARLGMTMLFFKTSNDHYGAALKGDSGWYFEEFTDRRKSENVALLFTNLRKQIRTGYFTLPNVLESGVSR